MRQQGSKSVSVEGAISLADRDCSEGIEATVRSGDYRQQQRAWMHR